MLKKECLRDYLAKSNYQAIAEYYGLEHQLHILQEESAELIQAASKFCRYHDQKSTNSLAEEIADTYIMLAQVEYLVSQHDPNFGDKIHDIVKAKINRCFEAIKENTNLEINKIRK